MLVSIGVISFSILAAIIISAASILCYRKKVKQELNTILQRLDMAIGGTEQKVFYDESMDSAIGERVNQLIQISKKNCNQANTERNIIKSLISDISHQIRTPLTNIMLYAGLLKEQEWKEDSKKIAKQIHKQTEKLDFLMRELVRFSYLETEMIIVTLCGSSVDKLIENACQIVEMKALKKEIMIQFQSSGQCCRFDMKWTVEALANLLDNAIKYSPVKSEIQISVIPYESFVCICVKDNGIGIEEKEQGLIFQRFYRSAAVSKEQGLGIGLYLAREIIGKQGGYIKVASTLGQGSIFSVFLPK